MEDNQDPKQDPSNLPSNDEQINDDNQGSDTGSSDPKQVEAYRKQQARADKAAHESDDLREEVTFLQQFAYEKMRDDAVNDFLKENGKKFPNVSAEDLKKFVSSPDELESTSKFLQDKHDAIKQETLANAREVPEESITVEERDRQLSKLRESNDPNRFQKFLRLQSIKTRK